MTFQAPVQPFSRYSRTAWARWSAAEAIEVAARDYHADNRGAAARRCLDILTREPRHFSALHLLGVVWLEDSRFVDAIAVLERAVREQPYAARVHLHLGNALLGLARLEEAAAALRRATSLEPGNPNAWNNLGNTLKGLDRDDEALVCYERALAAFPGHAPTLYNLGRLQAKFGQSEAAVESFRAAIANAGPQTDLARLSDAYIELGRTLTELHRYDEALTVMRAMREVDPSGRAEWHQSLILLAQGDYAEGWPKYEFRYVMADRERPHPAARAIDASTIAGRRVLVCGEQGHGDTIQFVRYVPLLVAAGATVSLSVYPELKPLITEMNDVVAVIEPGEEAPPFDVATALPSLPLAFHTELATIPASVPYLYPPPARLAAWRERLGPRRQPRIGLCWRGSQHIPQRSIPASALAPLFDVPGVEFHAVQYEVPGADREWLAAYPNVSLHGDRLTDFADTAALIGSMDLVVTIDTAVAHLAGALAMPVWIMLSFSADWRWLIDRDDSPWYPTARLFRQKRSGDWDSVVAAVAQALGEQRFPQTQIARKVC